MKSEKRMYVLVPYNLSDIQKGIQALHAVAEMSYNPSINCNDFKQWVNEDKTVIILNAGTTGKNSTMYMHKKALKKMKVEMSIFREPDLNNAMTAIAFIVDMQKDIHILGYLKQMKLA